MKPSPPTPQRLPEKSTKESKPMSEKKETIEERYADIKKHEGLFGTYTRNAVDLLDDLMTEREEMKERIEELELDYTLLESKLYQKED